MSCPPGKTTGKPQTLLAFTVVRTLVWFLCLGTSGYAQNRDPQAYPTPMPRDISFETVLSTEGYPALQYAVPVIGWKHHPEEIHVTPAGGLVLPTPRRHALSLQPLLIFGADRRPALLSPARVQQRLVGGYMPGILSDWKENGLTIQHLAFGSLLNGEQVLTGREVLVGLSRFTLRNDSNRRIEGSFCIRIGEGARHQSINKFHPVYPGKLEYSDSMIREENGDVTLRVIKNSLGETSFATSGPAKEPADSLVVNGGLKSIDTPELEMQFERKDGVLTLGGRAWPKGLDLYMEMSPLHSSPVVAAVEVATTDKGRIAGWLGRGGFVAAKQIRPEDYLSAGEASGSLSWKALQDLLPEGRGKLLLRPFCPPASQPVLARSWEPRVLLVPAGSVPSVVLGNPPISNLLRFGFDLQAGQSGTVELAVPYFPLGQKDSIRLAKLNLDDHLKHFERFWERELNRNAQFVIPDEHLRNAYRACLAYNMLLVDRDPGCELLLPHPDATDYEKIWGGDSGVILQGMDRLGYFSETEDYTRIFLARQGMRRPEGDIQSEQGFLHGDARERWLSENGFLIWALAEHYKLSGDVAWLKIVAPRMIAAADWIIREREHNKQLVNGARPPHYGLLPRGRATDLGDWDYWFFNDAYSYLGLRSAAAVLSDAGYLDDVERIRRVAEEYRECILAALETSINRKSSPPFVPLTPYKSEMPTRENLYRFWYSIVSPIYMVEAGVFGPNDEKASWILETLESKVLVSGLPRFTPDEIDPHYVYNQSLTQLLRGEKDKFIWNLYSLFAFGQSRNTFATIEVVNYRTGGLGENWDACQQPHMHSNSRVLAMLRIALALEDADKLHLMMGAPRGWLDDGKTVQVKAAPTYFGELNFKAESRASQGEITFRIQPPQRHPAHLVLHVRPPTRYGQIRSVTVDGKRWDSFGKDQIDLGVLDREATVRCTVK